MRFWPRSKAARDRAGLEALGRSMTEGFAAGMQEAEAHLAACPESADPDVWRKEYLEATAVELFANPVFQRQVTAAQLVVGPLGEATDPE